MIEEQQNDKFIIFKVVKQKYPYATNAHLNYLLKGISLDINQSVTNTVAILVRCPEIFVMYYENREVKTSNSFWLNLKKELIEWWELKKLSKIKI